MSAPTPRTDHVAVVWTVATPSEGREMVSADFARTLERELAAAHRALRILRTSPSVLPMMSGTHLTSHQICDLIDSAMAGQAAELKPDPKGIDWMREESARAARYETALRSISDHDSGAWAAGRHRGDAFEAAYVRVCVIAFEALNPPAPTS